MTGIYKKRDVKFIFLREGLVQSIIADTYTFCMVIGLVGIGVFLDSIIIQIIGAFMFMAASLLKSKLVDKRIAYSFDEARAIIDETEAAE